MVEDAEREHEVELSMPLGAQVPHVPELEVDLEPERTRGEARLLETRLASLDRDDDGAAPRELERIHALEASEVEYP